MTGALISTEHIRCSKTSLLSCRSLIQSVLGPKLQERHTMRTKRIHAKKQQPEREREHAPASDEWDPYMAAKLVSVRAQ